MKMQIFGRLRLYDQNESVNESDFHSNKLVKLLAYIILHRDRQLTHQELIEVFWEDERSKNPEGALKNLVYRLRTQLRVFGDTEYILTFPGVYQWNPRVKVETDYEQFEQTVKKMRTEKNTEKRKLLCEEAIKIYSKDVSASIASEYWMVSVLTYYKLMYMETVRVLAGIYGQEQRWDELDALCWKTMPVDSLDEEIHYWLIKSQIGKKNYDRALEYYENAKKVFYDNLGIRQVVRFEEVYEEILAMSDNRKADLKGILGAVCEDSPPKEAFLCEYPVFREIYRIEARRIKRTGIAEYFMLITIKKMGKGNADTADTSIKAGMQILEDLLRRTLRIGDVAARCSTTQFVLLLPNCNYESALIVAERIENKFRSAAGKRRLMLQFEMEELSAETQM